MGATTNHSERSPAPIIEVIVRLKEEYPGARTELRWEDPLQLLVATILSAQSTDVRVNQITGELFEKYHTAENYAEADPLLLEEQIRPVGFFRNKSRSIKNMARALVEEHGGEVPRTMEELVRLPGVGRKTANAGLGNGFSGNGGGGGGSRVWWGSPWLAVRQPPRSSATPSR